MRTNVISHSPVKRRSQIISTSLVDYLRSKAKSLQQIHPLNQTLSSSTESINREMILNQFYDADTDNYQNVVMRTDMETVMRDDVTLRRGSILSLGSVSTTSFVSANEELTASDSDAVCEDVSASEDDFMSTDEFFHKYSQDKSSFHLRVDDESSKNVTSSSEDEYFLPRPLTPTPGYQPPEYYDVTESYSAHNLTRQSTVREMFPTSSDEMETAESGSVTPVPPNYEHNLSSQVHTFPPELLSLLRDCKIFAGRTCVFSCKISSSPPAQVSWYRNGIRIQTQHLTEFTSSFSVLQRFKVSAEKHTEPLETKDKMECILHKLTISDCRITDNGEYSLAAINDYGSTVSTAQLLVEMAEGAISDKTVQMEPEFSSSLCDSDGMFGGDVTMTFQVRGYPEPEIFLFHKKELIEGEKVDLVKEDNGRYLLTVHDLRLEDEGELRVRAVNDAGFSECSAELFVDERIITPTPGSFSPQQLSSQREEDDSFMLDIGQQLATQVIAPYFDDITEDLAIPAGTNASFLVRAYAWPAPTVTWYKEDYLLNEGAARISFESTDFGTHVIKIRDVTEDDAGIYTCEVKNSAGSVSCKAELTIVTKRSSSVSSEEEKDMDTTRNRLKDHYSIQNEVGCGAFSIVRLVTTIVEGGKFAAKYIHCVNTEKRETFRSEIHILKKLSHLNILRFEDTFETKKNIILITEYLDYEWFQYLLDKTVVYEYEIAQHMLQVCDGLCYLHENNIVHLDLKPENLMVTKDQNVMKIIDFGSAKELVDGTILSSNFGNPEFVSPEVVLGNPVGYSCDMWSLGVIAYVVVSGVSPFLGESDHATVLKVREGSWHFDSRWFSTVTDFVMDFIGKLLVVDPQQRLKSSEARSHAWLKLGCRDTTEEGEKTPLPDGRLKYFLSRRKWQRSLVTPKTSLMLRSISSLVLKEFDSTCVAVSRNLVTDYVSSSTITESDDETDDVKVPGTYRNRAVRMKKLADEAKEFIHNRRDSIMIENMIEQQEVDDEASLPTVNVIDSTPKSSPLPSRKHIFVGEDSKMKSPHLPDKNIKITSLAGREGEPRTSNDAPPPRLSQNRMRLKAIGKKVSFEDGFGQSCEHSEVEITTLHEEPLNTELEIISNEEPTSEQPPVKSPIKVPPYSVQEDASSAGIVIDRPRSVSKMLKEEKKAHKSKRRQETEPQSKKEKFKKKLSMMTLLRQRSFDNLSSSSDEDSRKDFQEKDASTTKLKSLFFPRRKRPLLKAGSLDSSVEDRGQDYSSLPTSPVPSACVIPGKGILKRGTPSDSRNRGYLSDPHIQSSLHKLQPLKPPAAAHTTRESLLGPRRFQRKPLTKGVSLDLDIVNEGPSIDSLPARSRARSTQTASEKRRLQMRRGSSAESALPPPKSRPSGLRGPLLEKDTSQGDDEPIAGMFLRRSVPTVKGELTHSRSRSMQLDPSVPSLERSIMSARTLSSPLRKYSPVSRSHFTHSMDLNKRKRSDTEYSLEERKFCSDKLPTRSRSYDRSIWMRSNSSERRPLSDSYAPYIKVPLVDQGVASAQTYVTLFCVFDAFPLPEVTWFKDGEEFNSSDRMDIISEAGMNKYQLKIRNFRIPEDFGNYACEASNIIGTTKTACKLKPAVVPEKPTAPELAGRDEHNVWITWNPPTNCPTSPISYALQYREMAGMQWVLVNDAIIDSFYQVQNLRPTTSYRFRVRAKNNAGTGPFSKVSPRIQIEPGIGSGTFQYTF